MPLLRPTNGDYIAFLKAAASTGGNPIIKSRSANGVSPLLGVASLVTSSYVGSRASPSSSALNSSVQQIVLPISVPEIPTPTPTTAAGPAVNVLVWDNADRLYLTNSLLASSSLITATATTITNAIFTGQYFSCVFVSTNTWLAVNDTYLLLYKTINNGLTWTQITPVGIQFIEWVYAADNAATTIYACDRGALWMTGNGGITWYKVAYGGPSNTIDYLLVNGTTAIWSGLYSGDVRVLSSFGTISPTSSTVSFGISPAFCSSFIYFNSLFFVLFDDGTSTYKSTSPDGVTWTNRLVATPFFQSIQTVRDPNIGTIVTCVANDGTSSAIKYSIDNGDTWYDGVGSVANKSVTYHSRTGYSINLLAFTGNQYIVRLSDNTNHVSINGKTWSAAPLSAGGSAISGVAVAYNPNSAITPAAPPTVTWPSTTTSGSAVAITMYNVWGQPQWNNGLVSTTTQLATNGIVTYGTTTYYFGFNTTGTAITLNNGYTLPSTGPAFLVCVNGAGLTQWYTTVGSGMREVWGAAADSSGVYCIGCYISGSTVTILGAGNVSSSSTIPTSGSASIPAGFIVKYSPTGSVLFAIGLPRVPGSGLIRNSIAVSGTSLYVAAQYGGSVTYTMLNAGGSSSSLTIDSTTKAYVAQYDSTVGTINWVTPIVATTFSCTTMSADGGGPVIAGQYTSSAAITINENSSLGTLSIASGTPYIYIARFNPDGSGYWGFSIPQTGAVTSTLCASGCTIDPITGSIYLCGNYQNSGSITLGGVDGQPTYTLSASPASNTASFLIKTGGNGHTSWCTSIRDDVNAGAGLGGCVITQRIGDTNCVFFGGIYYPSSGVSSFYIKNAAGTASTKLFGGLVSSKPNAFIVQYDEEGNVFTARTFPRTYTDQNAITHVGLSTDSNGNLYSTMKYVGGGGTIQAAY